MKNLQKIKNRRKFLLMIKKQKIQEKLANVKNK